MKQKTEHKNKKHVLLVDDNEINLLLVEKMILRAFPSMKISKASDGREAVELFQKTRPNLILMDLQMPEMDGYEAAKEIRSIEGNLARTPIFALTAGVYEMEIEECYACGMDNYLNKPIKEEILYDLLNKSLNIAAAPVPSIDFSRLEQLLKYDSTSYKAVLSLALSGKNSIVFNYEVLKTAIQEDDKTSIKYYSHKLKGLASSMCADNLYSFFKEIESSFDKGLSISDLEEIDQEVTNVDQLLRQALESADYN